MVVAPVAPTLLIFDIDSTLIVPGNFDSPAEIYQSFYDPRVLTPYLGNAAYQVAFASYNHCGIPDSKAYFGKNLARAIIRLQHPEGKCDIPDEFLQCWAHYKQSDMQNLGKFPHLKNILICYRKKYGQFPINSYFYDDLPQNAWTASRLGINGKWCPNGLTTDNLHLVCEFGHRLIFRPLTHIDLNLSDFRPFKRFIKVHGSVVHVYLPLRKNFAGLNVAEFLKIMQENGIKYLLYTF